MLFNATHAASGQIQVTQQYLGTLGRLTIYLVYFMPFVHHIPLATLFRDLKFKTAPTSSPPLFVTKDETNKEISLTYNSLMIIFSGPKPSIRLTRANFIFRRSAGNADDSGCT